MSDFEANRCRLILCASADEVRADMLQAALGGGDVASLILYSTDKGSSSKQADLAMLVSLAHEHDVATIVTDETQIAGRTGAEGVMVTTGMEDVRNLMDRTVKDKMIGCGNIKNRHTALAIGELQPDFLFFGKPGGDIKPEPHPKNLALAEWWSEMVEIPCVLMGGNSLEPMSEYAGCGAEFIALEKAVWGVGSPNEQVETANNILEEYGQFDFPE